MKFIIERISTDTRKPYPKAKFEGFDDYNDKIYSIEINTIEELMDIMEYNHTDIQIFPPVNKGELPTITVSDVYSNEEDF